MPPALFWDTLHAAWEKDGLRKLEQKWSAEQILFTFSVRPQVSPVFFAGRVKRRLQHALRKAGLPTAFSRKVGVGTVGKNHRADVQRYIEGQVKKGVAADPRFEELLREFTVAVPSVDLSLATETNSGRYWYNLHLVLVAEGRYRIGEAAMLRTLRDWCFKVATKRSTRFPDCP